MISLTRLAQYPALIRLLVFILTLLLLWLPLVGLVDWLVDDPNTVSILVMSLLFGEFVLLLRSWGRIVYQYPHLIQSYGLSRTRQNGFDLLGGLCLGLVSLLSLFLLQAGLHWLVWQPPDPGLVWIILEGLLVSLGIGLGEELIFRGWLLDELQRDYGSEASLWLSSVAYACLHFIKPIEEIWRTLPEFPGLLLLGLTLVWAKRSRQGRLGLPIGLHAGLVWGYYIIKVGDLADYSNQVPTWVTGIDENPLAGVVGLLFLTVMTLSAWWRSRQVYS